ncbi:hypothetical protein [Streptomyces sp. CBMA29]|uniref:hypothetical protein n=1 Tax=Streptomyces sp. CBMA29 TaxID=1896314 RepID=UPI00166198E3|nr:hypothetical protein [Streptomyces sp. CBMA29]MBD0738579.1 hypothetical protein [Streptomyces sp. CBMA29]
MNRRRTAIAVVLGTAAAFLATACGPSDTGSSAPANSGTPATSSSAPAAPSASAPAMPSPKATVPTGTGDKGSTGGSGKTTAPAATGAKDPAKGASPIRTTKLVDGSTAKIYKLGDTHYYAKVIANGELFTSLETTNGHVDGVDANDMFIVLDLDGTIHSWTGGAQQGPGTFTLAGGWTAKVTRVAELHYSARISGGEGDVATLDAKSGDDGHSAGVNANGIYIVLGNDGQISAHA